jgi:hypothetical protein
MGSINDYKYGLCIVVIEGLLNLSCKTPYFRFRPLEPQSISDVLTNRKSAANCLKGFSFSKANK